ncbi:MAG: hypothetical protein UZ11_BCD004001177 [Bacteroidetes bacterium OLB11]|nr:MAG: hypothetical protein UZ11_BCD004001177 [Bacteroidetes bacterium OLB11]
MPSILQQKIPIEQILKFAKTNEEKANVYLLAGIEKYDKALPYIQKMYEYNPTSDGLSFLLLREINKIEDFVFTPYYTLFQPSLSYDFWNSKGNPSIQQILKRSETDRIYAKEVLRFINKVDILKVDNPFLWQSSKAYLLFITRDYHSCLTLINQLEKSAPDQALNQIKIIKALALTAKQKRGEALIPTETQSTLIANKNNSQFIFAIGKELEYLGNSTDAALLYSKLANTFNKEEADANKIVFWKMKTKERKAYHTDEYFVDYFDYSDFVYTTEQTQNLIENIQKNKEHKDSFSVFKYEVLKDQIPKLYDLLGTKYIRQNKLENALATFEKSGNQYWNRAYTLWDDKLNIFDQNPFYNLKYTPQFITPIEKIRLNKYTVTKQLINYLQKAENPNEKNRDYYYFLVANAYYNMGREGNISMMRRLNGWSGYYLSNIEDEIEFRQSNLAKHYYLLAKQYAQTKKFEALCLRMVVRCEKHKIEYNIIEDRFSENDNVDSMISLNKYYLDLKKNYSDYFDDLVSNCDNFKAYFEARR